MDRKERQDEDIMSLEDEKWPLWSKKEGKEAWEMRHEARLAAWKFRTQKSDGIIYSDFEEKFGVLSGVHYIYTIYLFEAREVRSPTLQTVCKSELKWRSYGYLKTTTPSWRVISKWFRNSTYDFEIQLMNSKSNSKWHQFRIHPLPLWCFASSTSGIASRALHPP